MAHSDERNVVQTVAICDTEPIAIQGLRALLESEGLRVVAAEDTLPAAMDAVCALTPSLLILDNAFGTLAVMDFLKVLASERRPITSIVWSSSFSEAEALRFLRAGALGVVRKRAALDTLLKCVRAVAAGRTWIDEGMVCDVDRPVRNSRSPLTARELQVMALVERGFKNKDIGSSLGIRTGTVKIHLKHIFEKTGIRGRYGLALSGLKEKGLLTPTGLEIAS